MNSKIFFRADGNASIGLGHVIRSLALAEMLKNDFECIFVIQNPSEYLVSEIKKTCEHFLIFPETTEILNEAQNFANQITKNDIVVLDGYKFVTAYQQILKNKCRKLICIDDVHSCHFVADVVINHAGSALRNHYSAEFYTSFCLGFDYALLRKPFLQAAEVKRNIEKFDTAFVSMGGGAILNVSLKILKTLNAISEIKRINFVRGSKEIFENEIIPFLKNTETEKIKVFENVDAAEMVELLQNSDVAICPASTLSLECCSVGIGLFCGYTVDNQVEIHSDLAAKNLIFDLKNLNIISENDLSDILFANFSLQKLNEVVFRQKEIFKNTTFNLFTLFKNL